MLPDKNVIQIIPQRPPFIMIGELLSKDEHITRSSFAIPADNVLAANGYFTEAGIIENIAQTAAARAGYEAQQQNQPVAVGFITLVKNLEIIRLPKAGQTLLTEVEIQDQIFNTTLISGKVWCNKELIAQCNMSIMIQEPGIEEEA
ncbi:flexirubin biosynthesis protein [Mucilaginibacter koreensis]